MGCYIPPYDLATLTCVEAAWCECPAGAHPILVGGLNLNLCAPCTEREGTIAEQVDSGCHGTGRHVPPLLSTRGETALGAMDVEDEEEGGMDLLPVQLLLGKGNRP